MNLFFTYKKNISKKRESFKTEILCYLLFKSKI